LADVRGNTSKRSPFIPLADPGEFPVSPSALWLCVGVSNSTETALFRSNCVIRIIHPTGATGIVPRPTQVPWIGVNGVSGDLRLRRAD
jgi:hypothetical protein